MTCCWEILTTRGGGREEKGAADGTGRLPGPCLCACSPWGLLFAPNRLTHVRPGTHPRRASAGLGDALQGPQLTGP